MKYIKLFENFNQSEIDDICEKYGIENYTINPDGSIDVDGDVGICNEELTKLPLKFNRVSGEFDCSRNGLTTLEGCPNYVGEDFLCNNNQLTNLIGCPNYVGEDFNCYINNLTSLEGNVNYIGGNFNCGWNNLTILDGCPKEVGGGFGFTKNPIFNVISLFGEVRIYLEYQETYNFLRKDSKIVKHLLIEALNDYNDFYNKNKELSELSEEIKGYTYI
jgi:hypothetical protein